MGEYFGSSKASGTFGMQLSPQEQTYRKNAQKLDEESFKRYFEKKGFDCEKMDEQKGKLLGERRPDFRVFKGNLEAIFEIKSLYEADAYIERDNLRAGILGRLETIQFPYRYSIFIGEFSRPMDLDGFIEHVKQKIINSHPITDFPLVINWCKPRMTLELLNRHEGANLKFRFVSEVATRSTAKERVILRIGDAFNQLKRFRNLPCAIIIYKNTPDLDEEDMQEIAYGDYRFVLDSKTGNFVNSYFANNQTFSKKKYPELSAIILAKRIEEDSIENVKFSIYDNPVTTHPLPKEFFTENS